MYLLYFQPGRTILQGATHFSNAFDRQNPRHSYQEALLQLVLVTVQQLRANVAKMQETRGADGARVLGYEGDPIRMYLETVVTEAPPGERAPSATDAARPYLNNIPHTRRVVEYRLWLFILEPRTVINFDLLFLGVRAALRAARNANAPITLGVVDASRAAFSNAMNPVAVTRSNRRAAGGGDDDDGLLDVALCSYSGAGRDRRYATRLAPNERFRIIRSRTLLAMACDSMLGLTLLTMPETLQRIACKELNENPVRPQVALNPTNYFLAPGADARALQTTFDHYYHADTKEW